MCYTLSAEKILLNYFAAEPESIEVSFEEISILSCKIVKQCNNSIITRISTEDIKEAVYQRPNIFRLVGASVVLLNRSNYLFKNIDILNQAMPRFVKDSCEVVCLEYAKKRRV